MVIFDRQSEQVGLLRDCRVCPSVDPVPGSVPLQITATLKGHTKKVTNVLYHMSGNKVVSASPDSTIRVWDVDKAVLKTTIKVRSRHMCTV